MKKKHFFSKLCFGRKLLKFLQSAIKLTSGAVPNLMSWSHANGKLHQNFISHHSWKYGTSASAKKYYYFQRKHGKSRPSCFHFQSINYQVRFFETFLTFLLLPCLLQTRVLGVSWCTFWGNELKNLRHIVKVWHKFIVEIGNEIMFSINLIAWNDKI